MAGISPSSSKREREYIGVLEKHPDQALLATENAPLEGFEYFASEAYRTRFQKKGNLLTDKLNSMAGKNFPRFVKIMGSNVTGIFGARKQSFTDISAYLTDLDKNGQLTGSPESLLKSYPNTEIWQALSAYAWDEWRVLLGFTEVPCEVIFRNKAVLFQYALVAIQEMDKDKIATAPDLDAGEEVLAVYNSLGLAVNDIARWMRKQFGLRCQANHPLGGLVSTVPLAIKAGMGWAGRNGLLITPEYGQRQRIAPIFVEAPIFAFTDSDEHRWIEEYCALCHRCQKACPTGAILEEKIAGTANIPGVGIVKTGIVREKCYPYFNATLGCSICVSVCPFSRANGTYGMLRKAVERQKQNV
jgi:ferredoxin